jgi:hypothetical protein
MQITKYTKGGKDKEHDIHYEHERATLRFASNEEEQPEMRRAFNTLTDYAGGTITDLAFFEIARIEWKRKKGVTTVKIIGHASAKNSGYMKVELPEFGYFDGTRFNELTGQEERFVREVDCDMTGVESIKALEAELARYVASGASQLQFDFTEDGKVFQMQR